MKKGNIAGWIFLWWQIPIFFIINRLPFEIRWPLKKLGNWFNCWHYGKRIIYTKEVQKNLEATFGSVNCWG